MAKALVGYLNDTDPRVLARLVGENRRLRQRVTDLEAQLIRLQAQNDALVASMSTEELLTMEQMQPA